MSVRFATPEEIKNWNSHILSNPDGGNVFSGYEFAQQKETGGYKHQFLFVNKLAVTVLEKKTPPLGKLWYLPKGPNVVTTKSLYDILKQLRPFAKKYGVFVVRIETELPRSQEPNLTRHGLKKATPIIPNPSTITLHLTPSLDEIMTNLPQKGRHAIRRAQRDGVTVELVPANEKNCRTMYKLLSDTAEGQFGIRSYNYYKTFWQRYERAGYGQLFFARFEGKVVAGAYAMVFGAKSTYKDGASVRKRTAYGASHLLQWTVIEWAKIQGSLLHDFCGSPPSDELGNSNHPLYGVGTFKTAFNKTVTDYIGCYDLVVSPWRYKAWTKLGERVYRHFYFKRTRDYYY
jgi:lipid II:glycine glycyltransferase (peptidoglycan interpeptide bridge formation enzyme)